MYGDYILVQYVPPPGECTGQLPVAFSHSQIPNFPVTKLTDLKEWMYEFGSSLFCIRRGSYVGA